MYNDGNGDEGRRTACRRIEEIDKFRFSGWDDVGRKWEAREPETRLPSKRKCELPASMKEMEKNEERSKVASKSTGLNEGKESGESNNGKEKNEGGSDVARKVDTMSDQLKKGKEKEGGINEAGKVETRSGLGFKVERGINGRLNRGKEKNARGSNVAGRTEAMSGKLNEGKEKNDGGNNVVGKVETRRGQLNRGKEKGDKGSNFAGKAEPKSGQFNEKENKVVGRGEKKGGLVDILGILKTNFQNLDNDDNKRRKTSIFLSFPSIQTSR